MTEREGYKGRRFAHVRCLGRGLRGFQRFHLRLRLSHQEDAAKHQVEQEQSAPRERAVAVEGGGGGQEAETKK